MWHFTPYSKIITFVDPEFALAVKVIVTINKIIPQNSLNLIFLGRCALYLNKDGCRKERNTCEYTPLIG